MSKQDEWQEEPGLYGKRYRWEDGPFGHVKEYEPTITTTHGEMTLAQYDRLKERMDEEI